MRIQMAFLICLSLAALTLGLIAAAGGVVALERPPPAGFPYETVGSPAEIPGAIADSLNRRRIHKKGKKAIHERGIAGRSVGVSCAYPRQLRLLRFEDGSAQLKCAERVLVRVSIPQH